MSLATPANRVERGGMSSTDFGLYTATVLAWGFSWITMKGQVGVVSPEVSVFWRFVLASSVMMLWASIRGHDLRFTLKDHLRFAALGVFLFSTNFTLFYYGAQYLPSGLLAVIFSTASVFNLFLGLLFFGQRPNLMALAAGVLGFTGVGLMFWPKFASAEFGSTALFGLMMCIGGTLSFCMGNMVSAATQRRGIGVTPATAWGMVYGTAFLGLFALLRGNTFEVEWTVTYLGSLVYLAVVSSVIAFASYLTLLGRIGAARAGYATVIFPVVALAVSTAVEGYQWTAVAFIGLLLVLGGNILMLRSK